MSSLLAKAKSKNNPLHKIYTQQRFLKDATRVFIQKNKEKRPS